MSGLVKLIIDKDDIRYSSVVGANTASFINSSHYLWSMNWSGFKDLNSPKGRIGLSIREWTCALCGAMHDRDVNAAKNILRLGHQTP